MTDSHPNAGPYLDRHGRLRWRFRHKGRTVQLPHEPGHPEFEAAYSAAAAGLPKPKPATVVRLNAPAPRSLRACFVALQRTAEWKRLSETSRRDQRRVAERFLTRPVVTGEPDTWGDMPIADLRRIHVKRDILSPMADTPHAADHVLRMLRKLVTVALDEEWIEIDPTHRIRWRPETRGHRAWKPDELVAFERRWPTGSTPRLVYAMALCLGARRVDLVRLRWEDVTEGGVAFRQVKTGVDVSLDILPALAREIAQTQRRGGTILVTKYGSPFSDKSLTGRFRDWCEMAGLSGCTLHGLRKTLGEALADGGATAKQIQAVLGHTTLQQADLYTRSADRRRAATAGLKVVRFAKDG